MPHAREDYLLIFTTLFLSPVTRNKKTMAPMVIVMKPGTKKDHPQGGFAHGVSVVAQNEGMTAPRIFPKAVWVAHMPMRSPRL